jgi:hypothetical protein
MSKNNPPKLLPNETHTHTKYTLNLTTDHVFSITFNEISQNISNQSNVYFTLSVKCHKLLTTGQCA